MAKQRLTDMRLVSQVEYNQAINEAFKGTAWIYWHRHHLEYRLNQIWN